MAAAGTPSRWHDVHPHINSLRAAALALDGACLACAVFFVVAGVAFGQRGAELPTDNWWLFGPMAGAGLAALAGGVVALAAALRGDRHAILSLPLGLAGLAALAIVGAPLVLIPLIVGGLTWFLVLARRQRERRR